MAGIQCRWNDERRSGTTKNKELGKMRTVIVIQKEIDSQRDSRRFLDSFSLKKKERNKKKILKKKRKSFDSMNHFRRGALPMMSRCLFIKNKKKIPPFFLFFF